MGSGSGDPMLLQCDLGRLLQGPGFSRPVGTLASAETVDNGMWWLGALPSDPSRCPRGGIGPASHSSGLQFNLELCDQQAARPEWG